VNVYGVGNRRVIRDSAMDFTLRQHVQSSKKGWETQLQVKKYS